MSLAQKLFGGGGGKGQQKAQPSPQVAIQKLRETEDMLNKKTEYLEQQMDEQIKMAKKHGTKNKRAAIQALKRKKRLEKQLQQIDGTLSTIEFQREALENATSTTAVLESMGYAAEALKAAHKGLDVDKVHDLMDDIAEANELHTEITDVISAPTGFGEDVDEDDLLAELEEMEQEEIEANLLEIPADALPSVPTTDPVPAAAAAAPRAAKTQEDRDMEELLAFAN